ncbi:MAG: hypothetical protein ABEJ07_03420 [Candidatus Nanohaloarchaea archaeon]
MDIEQDYVEYVLEFSLALFAASAAYFFESSTPASYLVLLLVPLLFGYTAYISRESFSVSTFLGLIALIFVPLGPTIAAVAVFTSVGNILVSLFAGGERFRDYYSSTTLPLLLTGAFIGAGLFFVASNDPSVAQDIRNRAGSVMGENVENAVEDANLLQQQKEMQSQVVRQSSAATVTATRAYVLNQTRDQLSLQDQQAVAGAFDSAQQEVPERFAIEAGQQINASSVDISKTTKNLVSSNLDGKALLLLVPVITLLVYSLQPVIGFLTAFSATAFSMMMTWDD